MGADFEIASCHGDHAGRAYLTLRHRSSGTLVVIQNLPFEHEHEETLEQEQQRIATEAVRVTREAAEFLAGRDAACPGWPTGQSRCGAAPREGEPPNAFGYPTERA